MKASRFLLVTVAACTIAATPIAAHAPDFKKLVPPTQPDAKNDVAAFTLRYRQALEKLDIGAFKALHHPKVVVFESGHSNVGWDDYEKTHLKPEIDACKAFRFTRWEESSQVYGNNDTALVVASIGYAVDTKDEKHHEATGVATLLLRRAKEGWQVIHSHWSTARPSG